MKKDDGNGLMKIGVYQMAPKFGDKAYNLNQIEEVLLETDADLVVLPELCTTGYQFSSQEEVMALCESIQDGEAVQRWRSICQKKNMHLVAGLGERQGDICYNTSVLVGPEAVIGIYRKIHLFDEEKLWFKSGPEGFRVWDIGSVKIGMLICFDWIFPESVRSLALSGAELICHPANLVLPFCPDAMITRSVENRVFTATANRVGREARAGKKALQYIGLSQITSPAGERLVRFDASETGFKAVDIDPALARDKQITSRNDLWKDRKPDLYTC